jgi:acyl dehydratase
MIEDPRPRAQEIAEQPAVRWSDPFDRLAVGQRFRSDRRTVRDTDVIVFSALTGDWHPQHCDPDWAAASAFGERIAHGMLIVSLAVGLVPLDPERVLALRRVGDVIFVAGELTALRRIDAGTGLVDFSWAIRNQDAELVCRANVQVLWRREDAQGDVAGAGFWHEAIAGGGAAGEFMPVPL